MNNKNFFSLLLLFSLLMAGCAEDSTGLPVQLSIDKRYVLKTDLPPDEAEAIADMIRNTADRFEETFSFPSKRNRQFRVLIFQDLEKFRSYRNKVSPTKSDYGFFLPEKGELGLVYRDSASAVRHLNHELFHAYFEDRIIHPPAWLNEGMAEYFEKPKQNFFSKLLLGDRTKEWVSTLRSLKRKGQIPHLEEIIMQDWPNRHALTNAQYALSWSIAKFFVESNEHHDAFHRYLQMLYDKKDPRKAFTEVWPDINMLHQDWIKTI